MTLTTRLLAGVLVDSRCWAAEERNIDPSDTQTYVDRDRNLKLSSRSCSRTD